jgi:hypothetical protein
LREERGQQGGHISQESLGTFPKKENFCFVSALIYCCEGDCIIQIRIVCTTEKRAHKLRQMCERKLRQLEIFAVEGQSVQQQFVSVFEVLFFLGGPYSSTGLARFLRQKFGGIVWVYKWISLAGICIVAADLYFPEAE